MKRSFLLFTAAAGIGYLTLSSYSAGPNTPPNSLGNRTPSGTNATCGASGCHGANDNGVTQIAMLLTEMPGGISVTNSQYKPNKVYSVDLVGLKPGATKFGFQITATKSSGTQGGTFVPGPNNKAFTATPLSGLEHSVAISPATPSQFKTQFTWNAPAAGSGPVTFHIIINGCNGNGGADGNDHATTSQITFAENTTSVASLSERIKISAYPNPAVHTVNLKFEDAELGIYTLKVMDLTGCTIHSEQVTVNGTTFHTSLNTSAWASGMHFAQVIKDDAQRMIPIVKQ